jgi:hypothetical protein
MATAVRKLLSFAILFLLVFASTQAGANALESGGGDNGVADPRDAKMINAYYHRCMNTVYQDQEAETRDEFCSCTSAQMEGVLTYAEIKTMATGKGDPVDKNTLAVKVIAPCLSAPLAELEYKACIGDTRYAHFFASQDAYNTTCHCMSAGMSDFTQQYAPDLLGYLLTQDPKAAKDPAEAIRHSAQYQDEETKQRNKCLADNAYQ